MDLGWILSGSWSKGFNMGAVWLTLGPTLKSRRFIWELSGSPGSHFEVRARLLAAIWLTLGPTLKAVLKFGHLNPAHRSHIPRLCPRNPLSGHIADMSAETSVRTFPRYVRGTLCPDISVGRCGFVFVISYILGPGTLAWKLGLLQIAYVICLSCSWIQLVLLLANLSSLRS